MRLHKLAMADVAMYSTALEFVATFWTQDVDYQELPGVRYQATPGATPNSPRQRGQIMTFPDGWTSEQQPL